MVFPADRTEAGNTFHNEIIVSSNSTLWRYDMKLFHGLIIVMCVAVAGLDACSVERAPDTAVLEPAGREAMPTEQEPVTRPADINEDSMARLPAVHRADLDEYGQRAYDSIVNPESRYADGLRGPVGMWMYSPQMAEHVFPASTYLRFGTQFDQRFTELAILTTAREINSQYVWSSHEGGAREAGLEDEIIEIVKHRRSTAGVGDAEATIIEFGREVVGGEKLSSETFANALVLFGEQGVMNLAGLMGYYSFVDITIRTFDVQLAPDRERLLPMP